MSPNCILERVTSTQSTNDDLMLRWRAGELIDPVARLAYEQTGGKGRGGKAWLAKPQDTLCFSLAYPFHKRPHELSGLSLVIGLAAISGIAAALNQSEAQLYEQGLRLKWPNDLLLNNAKLGGILIEGGQANPTSLSWMVIGLGLNLQNADAITESLQGSSMFGAAALNQLVSKDTLVPDSDFIWLKLIEAFEKYLISFNQYGFTHFKNTWSQWDAFAGQPVSISGAGKEAISGIAAGVDDTGALLINQNNTIIAVHAGDVSLRAKEI